MKLILVFTLLSLLSGCVIGHSSEIKRAEKILHKFECLNIDTQQIQTSSINNYHFRSLSITRERAMNYMESYKNGHEIFAIPLDEVIAQQYFLFKTACQSLGGVSNK